ncbi:MAG: arginyltransferase [Myxococcales bacterium]|nr:arginyltransferase [Myxococcales bacterium]MCB9705924.1 arginyltransferase [Myxococcales bacterium]
MSWRPRVLAGAPPELVVYDEPMPCPYIHGREARLPMRLPTRGLTAAEFDRRLQVGDRRQGVLIYGTACEGCRACVPIRLNVDTFQPNKTQRRIHRRGREQISFEIGQPEHSRERLALYNRHKRGRGLAASEEPMDEPGYRAFLVETCCDSFEIRYRVDGALIGVAIVDRAATALSAVYFYFDPDYSALSPGVFSVMTQVELCKRWGLRYLYLGFYIAECASMAYKSRYRPNERLIDGVWTPCE